jgi:hypothetical protein
LAFTQVAVPVRKTESRIPESFQASDFGEAVVAADTRSALVSFITSPVVTGRENVYVVYVTDAGLASSIQSFEWSVSENAGTPIVQSTPHGEFSYVPATIGLLDLTVRMLDAGNAQLGTLSLAQDIVAANVELEALVAGAKNEPGPGISSPDVARELVNDHNPYYQSVQLQTPESGDAFKLFVYNMVFDGALLRTAGERKLHLQELAASLNDDGANFQTLAAQAAGVSGIRLPLLAMFRPDMLEFTELPEPPEQRTLADEDLRAALAALDQQKLIDIFNLVRFPKSNITQCARLLEALRDHYFPGANFSDVMTGMSGTRAHWIIRHFREGPLIRT